MRKFYSCKVCSGGLILSGHEYVCPHCGTAANITLEPTILKNVPFAEKENYAHLKVDEGKRAREVKDFAKERIRAIPELQQTDDGILMHIEFCVGKIIDRCFSEHVKRDFPMPRHVETVACACILIALSNMRQYQGSIQTWQIVNPEDKAAIKKVVRLKDRIESSDTVDLFGCGILSEASEVDRLKSIMTRLCNKIELPYRITVKLLDQFLKITKSVLMDGKNTFYLAAAVIMHALYQEDGCKFIARGETRLTDDQIEMICVTLNLKKKSLLLYTNQLQKQCCHSDKGDPDAGVHTVSSSVAAVSSTVV
jgi:hypothetical protein